MSFGRHTARTCADCPQGNGAFWCNGDCQWVDSQCVEKTIRGLHLNTTPREKISLKISKYGQKYGNDFKLECQFRTRMSLMSFLL